MNKNKTTSIRINDKILTLIKKKGITPQKIIDEYIKKHFKIKTEIKAKSSIK